MFSISSENICFYLNLKENLLNYSLLFNTSAKEFEISPATDFEFSTIQFSALSESTDKPYTGRYFRKENLRDYIGSFADASIAELVKSIPDIRKNIEELKNSFKKLKNKRFSASQMILTIIITLLIAGLSAAYYFGGISTKIKTIEDRVDKLEIKTDLKKDFLNKSKQPHIEKNTNKEYEQGIRGRS